MLTSNKNAENDPQDTNWSQFEVAQGSKDSSKVLIDIWNVLN